MSRSRSTPKVRCVNCGCVLHWWAGADNVGYWKHCAGWRTPKPCKEARPEAEPMPIQPPAFGVVANGGKP